MIPHRLLPLVTGLGLLALGAVAPAQSQGFAQKTRTIRAAVLLLDNDKPDNSKLYGQTAAPFAFYNLDQAKGIKPDGWNFVNPYAPGVVTPDIIARYRELSNTNLPVLDSTIGKKQGAYWTVRLGGLSDAQLANYDVLLVASRYGVSLNAAEREKLRRFVDGGGVLWVDLYGANRSGNAFPVDPANNLPLSIRSVPGVAGGAYQDASSPLLSGVRQVNGSDLAYLNDPAYNAEPAFFGLGPVLDAEVNNAPGVGEFYRYRSIVATGSGAQPVIAEARLGDGTIVVTARGAAEMLNRPAINRTPWLLVGDASSSNVGYQSQPLGGTPVLNAQGRAAARLAVNIVSMGANFRQPGGGTRKTNSASADPGSPVLARFTSEGPQGVAGALNGVPNGTPVTYKGFLICSIGNRIAVYDAVPGRDLDGDGDPDDGIVDYDTGNPNNALRDTSVGKPLDLVWYSVDVGSKLSPPAVAEVPEAGAGLADQILATDANGVLHAFFLNEFNANGQAKGGEHKLEVRGLQGGGKYPLSPLTTSGTHVGDPIAPVVYNGLAFMVDAVSGATPAQGRIWVVDLSRGTSKLTTTTASSAVGGEWYAGGTSASGTALPVPTAAPTIGTIPINDNSGGSDLVMYLPGVYGTTAQPGFTSMWLGAKGESPSTWTANGSSLTLTTRAGSAGQIPVYQNPGGSPVQRQLSVHLTAMDANGNPVQLSSLGISGGPTVANGEVAYACTRSEADLKAAGIDFRLDYTIDWGYNPTQASSAVQRGTLLLPVQKSPALDQSKRILGPIAMTPRGTLHLVEGTPNPTLPEQFNGTYWAIREDAGLRGNFRVASRFSLYSEYSQTFGAALGTTVPAVLGSADGVDQYLPTFIRNGKFSAFYFAGGVALKNGVAYVGVNASRAGVLPVAMVAAFKAEPETPELRLGTTLPSDPVIQQADFARSAPNTVVRQPVQTRMAGDRLNVDVENGIIRIENLATVTKGEITDCLSLSQPVGVGSNSGNRAFVLRQPDAEGDRWSPLLWFGLWNGGKATAAPLAAGNEVFLSASSSLPKLADNGFDFTKPIVNSGVIWSIDGDLSTTNLFSVPLPGRPWLVQQTQISTLNGFDVSPYYRMPQTRGARDFNDWLLRLNQTKVGQSDAVAGVGGGDGIVTAYAISGGVSGQGGVYALSRSDFVVCDEGRLLRVDAAGNPLLNAFGGRFNGIGSGGSVNEQRNLVRPVKAYPVGSTDTLVVDAGANRIMRIDDDGTVLRSIDKIVLDRDHKPTNYRVNAPLTFKDPRDAQTFEGYVYKSATDPELVTAQQPVEYWIHYLVADSGNGRLVELIDRFTVDDKGRVGAPVTISYKDPEINSNQAIDQAQVGVLVWQSPTLEQRDATGDYYNSVSRVFLGTVGTGRYVYVAGVGRSRPTNASAGLDNPGANALIPRPSSNGGGAVVVFDPLGGTRVFDRFQLPNLTGVQFFQANQGTPLTGTFTTNTPSNAPLANERPFKNLVAVSSSSSVNGAGVASVRIMVTDVDAVYEFDLSSVTLADPKLDPTKDTVTGLSLSPRWMLNEIGYAGLRATFNKATNLWSVPSTVGLQFRPNYARRLDSGDVLVVNGYQGTTRDGASPYTGEVTLLDGNTFNLVGTAEQTRNMGLLSSVKFELPPLTGIRGLVSPVFADRR